MARSAPQSDKDIRFTITPHPRQQDRIVLRVSYTRTPEHQARISRVLDALVAPPTTADTQPTKAHDDRVEAA